MQDPRARITAAAIAAIVGSFSLFVSAHTGAPAGLASHITGPDAPERVARHDSRRWRR
jgi:hypothetical protein